MALEFISFFHNSDELRDEFSSKEITRPCFYWYSDRFTSHTGFKIKDKYFYLFVKNPIIDNVALRSRHEGLGFHGLHSRYVEYKEKDVPKFQTGEFGYAEPPILMSFSTIIPDLIAQYIEASNEYEVIKPIAHKGVRFKLYNDRYKKILALGIPFIEITEIINALPNLLQALPNISPKQINGKYMFDNWLPMVTAKPGWWL